MGRNAVSIVIWSLLLALAANAHALGPEDAREVQIRPELDRLPEELDGLQVRLWHTPHPQISVHNLTAEQLVVRDHADRPFLRLAPNNTHADLANAWFYRARRATDTPVPDDAGGPPRWRKVDSGPAFGWWDPRLRIDDRMQPPPGITGGGSHFLRRWRIPVRLGDITSDISGYFLYHPAPDGVHRAEVTSDKVLGDNVAVYPLLGKTPGLFIANHGNARFAVRGIEGEPFLRFVPGKVLVDPTSATWQQAAPDNARVPYDDSGKSRWVVIATTGGFGWHDPRVRADAGPPKNGKATPVKEWSIPVTVEEERRVVEGRTWWLPPTTGGLR